MLLHNGVTGNERDSRGSDKLLGKLQKSKMLCSDAMLQIIIPRKGDSFTTSVHHYTPFRFFIITLDFAQPSWIDLQTIKILKF